MAHTPKVLHAIERAAELSMQDYPRGTLARELRQAAEQYTDLLAACEAAVYALSLSDIMQDEIDEIKNQV